MPLVNEQNDNEQNLCQILKKHFAIRYPVGQWFLNFMHVETPDCKKKTQNFQKF